MPTLADSLVSSSARPLAIRKRPDLQVNQQRYQGRHYWIVKDPVGLNYFRFQEEEFAILNWLDGKTSLDDLRTRFEKQFAPQKIALDELGRLIGMLHQSALVIASVPGQGKQLLKRRWDRKKKEILGRYPIFWRCGSKASIPSACSTGCIRLCAGSSRRPRPCFAFSY